MRSSSSTDRAARSVLIPLDSAGATDPRAVGAKAAALALARRAGLPALPGTVLPVALGRVAASAGAAAVDAGGPAGARRAALGAPIPPELGRELRAAVDRLGGQVIVRSSSQLESDHRWSGAFSSISEVRRDDIVTAVRSAWAAAFAPDPLERARRCGIEPRRLGIAVLIQPQLTPTAGGLARFADSRVRVTAVAGHPGALLAGHVSGQSAELDVSGRSAELDPAGPGGRSPLPALTGRALRGVVALARRVADALGHDTIEWAVDGETVYLLQSSRAVAPAAPATRPPAVPGAGGRRVAGTAAVAGDAVGRLCYVRPHESAPPGGPYVLVCERPVPALAPLLFGAAALVSRHGPVDCHLVEVARSLGVPVLVDAAVDRVTGPLPGINAAGWLGAIDGGRHELVVFPQGAGEHLDPPSAFRKIASSLAPTVP